MRHQNDRAAVRGQVAQQSEQRLGLVRRQHRSRFVQNQDTRIPEQRLEDLHALPSAHAELRHRSVEIDAQPGPPGQLGHPRPHQAIGQAESAARRPHPQRKVLEHRKRRHELEVLMHHPDPAAPGLARGSQRDRRSIDLDPPFVRLEHPAEDAEQRRLSRAVLTQHAVHLAPAELEVGPVQRGDRAEAADDARHANAGNGHRASGSPSTKGTRGTSSSPLRMRSRASSIAMRSAGGTRSATAGFNTKSTTSSVVPV